VKPIVPYPPDQGTKVVSFDIIRALANSFDVTVLARALDESDVEAARELESWCERVVTVPAPNRRSLLHRVAYKFGFGMRSLSGKRSLKSLYDCPSTLMAAARELSTGNGFDLYLVEYWQLYPLFDVFPSQRTVLLTHDIDLLVNRQIALMEKRLWAKLRAVRRWRVEEGEEVRAYQRAQHVLALTERDANAVRKLSRGRADVQVLPFGVNPDHFASPGGARAREVLFMGALSASFNRDALEYFAASIYPLLTDAECDVTIVGGDLPDRARFLASQPRVQVVGRVPDVREYLHRAACIVIPLRFGGGLRIRTLEAMMAGLPVVCSSVAMAGMDFEAGRDYLQADTASETAEAVRRILDDPAFAGDMAAKARARAVECYGPGAAQATEKLFNSLL
jgi:glycosyltransferase involved in cell wall biosynthesis